MKSGKRAFEAAVHGVFLVLGLITVGCVLLISDRSRHSGHPGDRADPVSVRQTLGVHGGGAVLRHSAVHFNERLRHGGRDAAGRAGRVSDGGLSFQAASPRVKAVLQGAVSLLAGIPSVVYGLVGMLVLVPGIRKAFHLADGASLLAAIIVLAVMILPSIIKVSVTALDAVRLQAFRATTPPRRSRWARRRRKRTSAFPFPLPEAASRWPSFWAWGAQSARRWR